MDDAQTLAEFFHSAEVPIVAITRLANRYIEINLVVGVVWSGLADVPGDARAAEHDTGEGVV